MDLRKQSNYILKKTMELSLKRKEILNILRRIDDKLKCKFDETKQKGREEKIRELEEEYGKIREEFFEFLK